jgi:predicted NAD/FAD-dependent oxidoreductase
MDIRAALVAIQSSVPAPGPAGLAAATTAQQAGFSVRQVWSTTFGGRGVNRQLFHTSLIIPIFPIDFSTDHGFFFAKDRSVIESSPPAE